MAPLTFDPCSCSVFLQKADNTLSLSLHHTKLPDSISHRSRVGRWSRWNCKRHLHNYIWIWLRNMMYCSTWLTLLCRNEWDKMSHIQRTRHQCNNPIGGNTARTEGDCVCIPGSFTVLHGECQGCCPCQEIDLQKPWMCTQTTCNSTWYNMWFHVCVPRSIAYHC